MRKTSAVQALIIVIIVFLLLALSCFGAAKSIGRDAGIYISVSPAAENTAPAMPSCDAESEPPLTAAELMPLLSEYSLEFTDEAFTEWLAEFCGGYDALFSCLSEGGGDAFTAFGATELVLSDLYSGRIESADNIHVLSERSDGEISLLFGGDVCLADDWENMAKYYERGEKLDECLTGGLLEITNSADLFVVNNEFCFSERGEPLSDKLYTFRAKPANVSLLIEMGADLVSLANNHVYDYGYTAFTDTLSTLKGAGIPYIGAGESLDEAAKIQYFIVGGKKLALCAASRAEKYLLTPEATAAHGGVMRTYSPEKFLAVIAEARENADYVIAIPHWGTEYSSVLEAAQTEQAKMYIDAGADAVIGSHTHCLQGMEFYNGKPIIYSLGNFWFNHDDGDTALLMLTLDDAVTPTLIPCLQYDGVTECVKGSAEGERILKYLESISINVEISADGLVREQKSD